MDKFLEKVYQYLAGPFMSFEAFVNTLYLGPNTFIGLTSKTGLLYLFTGVAAAFFVYRSHKKKEPEFAGDSFWRFAFPRSVFLHRSAIVDYKYVGFDILIRFFLYIPFIAGVTQVAYMLFSKFSFDISFGLFASLHVYVRMAIVTFVAAAIVDFSVFFAHFLCHKVSFLWPFHEVHHSAEVLTPVTVHRAHPVEVFMDGLVTSVLSGALAATYSAMTGDTVQPLTLFGLNVISFAYYLFVYQLRHSHVWLSYGPVVSHLIVSPAQHQIHHSIDRKHWNKNYGFTFAFWDWLFGTLYVPKEREKITFGVPDIDAREFSTVPRLYFLPFVKSYRRLKKMIAARSLRFDFDQVVEENRQASASHYAGAKTGSPQGEPAVTKL